MEQKIQKKPQLIILYGAPGSGKGTQASYLVKNHSYIFLDFGQTFREFAKLDNDRSKRVKESLEGGKAILTEDFMYILKDKIEYNLKNNINFVIDKPGSLREEAEWLSDLIVELKISTLFLHLKIDYNQAVERILNRWYLPSSSYPYSSYQEAYENKTLEEEPYQRKEDQDQEITRIRIDNMYKHNQDIIDIYQKKGIVVSNIEAGGNVEGVKKEIDKVLA